MQKITFIKNYNNYRIGDTTTVSNNVAHGLIEKEIAILGSRGFGIFRAPVDKMMRTEKRSERKRRLRKESIKTRKPRYRVQ